MSVIRISLGSKLRRFRLSTLTGIPGLREGTIQNAVVYAQEGLLYNRIKKSGNSSILFYLRDMIQGGEQSTGADYESDKQQAAAVGRKLTELSVGELRRVRHCYRFTIFRNPYTRCLSAFLSKRAKRAAGTEKYRDIPGFDQDGPEGFAAFVGFLEAGGLYYDKHFWPQSDLLICPPEHFSRIGQLENLQDELALISRRVGLPMPAAFRADGPHAADRTHQGKVTGASGKAAAYYSEDLYRRVQRLYALDFEVGGYDPGWRAA
ncbi:MAG: sulfotransferase family 2 domain-containing protein [Ectothiorhodospiraceae bacterium]|nr:sulfotransferase family 2 domain-containing protein [Ectothiorhodospiraceae bacterium]